MSRHSVPQMIVVNESRWHVDSTKLFQRLRKDESSKWNIFVEESSRWRNQRKLSDCVRWKSPSNSKISKIPHWTTSQAELFKNSLETNQSCRKEQFYEEQKRKLIKTTNRNEHVNVFALNHLRGISSTVIRDRWNKSSFNSNFSKNMKTVFVLNNLNDRCAHFVFNWIVCFVR